MTTRQIYVCTMGGSRISSQGGGLKKIAPSRGRHEICWGISCEKSRFYAKKSYFFPILGCAPLGSAPVYYIFIDGNFISTRDVHISLYIYVFIDIILLQLHLYNNTRYFNLWFIIRLITSILHVFFVINFCQQQTTEVKKRYINNKN